MSSERILQMVLKIELLHRAISKTGEPGQHRIQNKLHSAIVISFFGKLN